MAKAPPPKRPLKADEPSVFASSKSDVRDIQLHIADDKLSGSLSVVFHTAQPNITVDEVMAFLTEQKVKVSEEGKSNLFKALTGTPHLGGLLGPIPVAQGKPPKKGSDGRVEWLVPPPEILREKKISAGRVDYREYHQIVNVR